MIQEGLIHDGNDKKTGRPQFLVTGKARTCVDVLLGTSATAKLWGLLWEWQDGIEGTKSDLAQCAEISRPTLYEILPEFIEFEWVIPSKIEKGHQYYKLNKNHFIVKMMMDLINAHVFSNVQIEMAKEKVKDELALKYKRRLPVKKNVRRK